MGETADAFLYDRIRATALSQYVPITCEWNKAFTTLRLTLREKWLFRTFCFLQQRSGEYFHSQSKNSFVEERQKHFKDSRKVQGKRSFHCGCTGRRWPFLLLLRYKMQMVDQVCWLTKEGRANKWLGCEASFNYTIKIFRWFYGSESWKRKAVGELRAGELV